MEAGFLEGAQGSLFYLLHEPDSLPPKGCVLYVHPFAEELNKSRRMAALQARQLSEQGYVVLQPDLYGCGDSGGDFADARWDSWLQDLGFWVGWLRDRYHAPLVLWGLRAGCLLITELLQAQGETPAATIFWQPVSNGELHLTQFLRLRMAAGMMGGDKETTAQLRARVDAGETLGVAGYNLSPGLAKQLAKARLLPPPRGPVCWLDVSQAEARELPPASARIVEIWRQEGVAVHATVVEGQPFWTTQEIQEVPTLLEATGRCLRMAP